MKIREEANTKKSNKIVILRGKTVNHLVLKIK